MLSFSAGLVFSADEILTWLGGMDKYNKGKSDKQQWMTLYNSDLLKIDRKRQANSIIVETPVVSIVGGTQPAVIPNVRQLWEAHDGFAERDLWSYPVHNNLGRWHEEGVIDRSYIDQVFSKLRKDPQQTFIFSGDAKSVWTDWYNSTKLKIFELPEGHNLKAVFGKTFGQMPRFALNLHLVNEQIGSEISADTLCGAIEVMDYFVDHSMKVRAKASQLRDTNSSSLNTKILEFLTPEWSNRSDIHRHLHNNYKASDIDVVLNQLEESKQIESRVQQGQTGRPAEEYRLAQVTEGSFSI